MILAIGLVFLIGVLFGVQIGFLLNMLFDNWSKHFAGWLLNKFGLEEE